MILIINTSKRKAQAIADIFYYMGVLSYAATPDEALSEISELYRAVLLIDPDTLPDTDDYVQKLRSYSSRIPVFGVSENSDESALASLDGNFPADIYSSRLIEEIVRYQKEHGMPLSSKYALAGIEASCDTEGVMAFDKALNFTKTETMILRYLIVSYPLPQDSANILRYAFKPLRKPEATSIRTHVSVMNKKFRDVRGKNLFVSIPGKGYVISTPEILKSLKEAN